MTFTCRCVIGFHADAQWGDLTLVPVRADEQIPRALQEIPAWDRSGWTFQGVMGLRYLHNVTEMCRGRTVTELTFDETTGNIGIRLPGKDCTPPFFLYRVAVTAVLAWCYPENTEWAVRDNRPDPKQVGFPSALGYSWADREGVSRDKFNQWFEHLYHTSVLFRTMVMQINQHAILSAKEGLQNEHDPARGRPIGSVVLHPGAGGDGVLAQPVVVRGDGPCDAAGQQPGAGADPGK